MSTNERIKVESKGLVLRRGQGRARTPSATRSTRSTAASATLSGNAKELSKFFGIYKQQARGERGKKTDDYFFMVRIKIPAGGRLSTRSSGLRSTTRRSSSPTARSASPRARAIQYHHVYGPKLAPLVRHLNRSYRGDGDARAPAAT